ncbi:MAG: hypothetical protein WB816_08445 [Methylocystis sp.]
MSNPRFSSFWRRRVAALAVLVALSAGSAALAQISLPGAVAPESEGSVAEGVKRPSGGGGVRARAGKPGHKRAHVSRGDKEDEGAAGPAIAPKPPSDDTIVGKTLYQDGSRSIVEFQNLTGETRLSRLTLIGDRMSRSGDSCRVEVTPTPLKLTSREGDEGVRRYQVEFPACPFSFDVLDGAILVTNEGGACEIKAADCRVDPSGLWGEKDFDEKRSKQMLGARARVEKTMRADFKLLYVKNKKDKPLRKLLVRVQAGFSSHREEICRNYLQEADYGYCALRVTEARALTLGTQLAEGVKRPADLPLEEPRKRGRKK